MNLLLPLIHGIFQIYYGQWELKCLSIIHFSLIWVLGIMSLMYVGLFLSYHNAITLKHVSPAP